MAKVDLNPLLEHLQGKIGDLVFRRAHTGKMSAIIRADMSKVKWSKAQVEHREKFRQAVIYGKAVKQHPELYAYYTEMGKQKNMRTWDAAVSDYMDGHDLLTPKITHSKG